MLPHTQKRQTEITKILQSDIRHDRAAGEAVAVTEEMYVAVVGIKGSTITAAPVRPRREHSAQSG